MKKKTNKFTSKILRSILVAFLMLAIQLPELNAQGSIRRNMEDATPQEIAYRDSLMNTNYDNMLPFLGAAVQAKGFEMPLPIGVMVNTSFSQQSLEIENLAVSFTEEGHYWYVSPFAEFDNVTPRVINANFRADVWIFPFLSVSGMVGKFKSDTDISLVSPFKMNFTAHNEGTIAGYGVLLAGGAGPVFATLSYNQVWSNTKMMIEPGITYNTGIRIGHSHSLNTKPWKSWTVYAAANWIKFNKRTIGKVNLNNLTGITQDDKVRASGELNEWYDELPPLKQVALKPFKEGIDDWLLNDKDTELYYDFNKITRGPWSYGIGGSFRFNKHWQLILDMSSSTFKFDKYDRFRVTFGLNYRLGLKMFKNR